MADDILNLMEKRRQVKYNQEIYETLHKEIRETNLIKLKRSGSMTSAETPKYTKEIVNTHCTKTLKKSLERKPAQAQNILI